MLRIRALAIALSSLLILSEAHAQDDPFGDDSGEWAFDSACDDNRFVGSDPHYFHWPSGEFNGHDATDCRELVEAGLINWRDAGSTGSLVGADESMRRDLADMRADLESLLGAVLRIEAGLRQAGYISRGEGETE